MVILSLAHLGGMYRLGSEGSSTRHSGGAVYGYLGYAMTTGHVMSQEREGMHRRLMVTWIILKNRGEVVQSW